MYFRILARFFNGRYLDEQTTFDIRQYHEQRSSNTGAFEDWPRPVGPRTAETEIGALSGLYEYMRDKLASQGQRVSLVNRLGILGLAIDQRVKPMLPHIRREYGILVARMALTLMIGKIQFAANAKVSFRFLTIPTMQKSLPVTHALELGRPRSLRTQNLA